MASVSSLFAAVSTVPYSFFLVFTGRQPPVKAGKYSASEV